MKLFHKGRATIGALLFAAACSYSDNNLPTGRVSLMSNPYAIAAQTVKLAGHKLTNTPYLKECTENGYNPNISQSRYKTSRLDDQHFQVLIYCSGNVNSNPDYLTGPKDMMVLIDIAYLGRQKNVTKIYDKGANGLDPGDFYSFEGHGIKEVVSSEPQSIATLNPETKKNLATILDRAIKEILGEVREI